MREKEVDISMKREKLKHIENEVVDFLKKQDEDSTIKLVMEPRQKEESQRQSWWVPYVEELLLLSSKVKEVAEVGCPSLFPSCEVGALSLLSSLIVVHFGVWGCFVGVDETLLSHDDAMSMNHCSSCSQGSSRGASLRGMLGSQICYCGELVVFRVAKTAKNEGKPFWGCPNYKVSSLRYVFILGYIYLVFAEMILVGCFVQRSRNEEVRGCNFFKWASEDNVDERDTTIGWQRRKIINLEKSLLVC
ncbi:hypothetical protein LR48_Vigan02g085400 [Vigna angularis]|uniref:GRF-type domain-containing protein n=1 Tax=Phaseolus angularis TaxID=3914 RepID=A0A0L9TWZ6_PHAAN|nr:hypothetical protein LR48_Vigan02g085400 [Vigna angularis]